MAISDILSTLVGYAFLVLIAWIIFKHKKSERRAKYERIRKLSSEQRRLEMVRLQSQLNSLRTSHILHFLISICTCGAWVIIWALSAWSNSSQRAEIEALMNETVNSEVTKLP
jgi:hypothetical protein